MSVHKDFPKFRYLFFLVMLLTQHDFVKALKPVGLYCIILHIIDAIFFYFSWEY